jgi:hypothetical protein
MVVSVCWLKTVSKQLFNVRQLILKLVFKIRIKRTY